MQPHPVPAHRLQHRVGPDHVGVQERLGIGQRVVDVCLGGEMHHGVGLGNQLRHQLGVGDVTLHQPDVVLDGCQRFTAACIGQRIEHRHRMLTHRAVHEVGADEPRATGDQQPHGHTVAVGGVLALQPQRPGQLGERRQQLVPAAEHLDRDVVRPGL